MVQPETRRMSIYEHKERVNPNPNPNPNPGKRINEHEKREEAKRILESCDLNTDGIINKVEFPSNPNPNPNPNTNPNPNP